MAAASLLKIKRPSAAVSVQELGSLRRTCFVRILPLSLTRPRSMAGDHGVATSAQPTLSPTSPPSGSKQVLISLSNKTNLEVLGRSLIDLGYTIVSTGGTAETLEKADIAVRKVEELTAFPEMLDGRVKTLHPTIHGGILARRDFHTHMGALKEWNIGGHRYAWKEGCFFGLPWHQKMSRSLSTVKAPLLSPPSTEGKEQPVPSPLTMVPSPSDSTKKSSAEIDRKRPVQAVLKKIKESPKKVNLVAALVRGMRVEDALLQLAVLQKRAAKTVKRVVSNARANATHNHGLNGDRLFVAEAFVGKGKYLKRLSYHAKGRSGIMHHPSCRLTVIVKELSDEQEAEIARYKTMTFRERAKVKTRLIPHKLIETMPSWHRTSQQSSGVLEA